MFWKKKEVNSNLYDERVQDLKLGRKQIMSNIHLASYSLKKSISKFNDDSKVDDIKFSDMETYPMGEKIPLNDKVTTKLKLRTKNKLIFDVFMESSGSLVEHYHSDCTETIHIKKGCFIDLVNEHKCRENETVFYKAGKKHYLTALEDTYLEIEFEKI